jgi:hypothetical protein
MWMRVIGVVSVVCSFGVVGCGDDDSGFEDSCTMGAKSTPGADNDPCPQTDPKCPAAMFVAVASCGMDGTWAKDATGSIMCACVPKAGTMSMAPATGTGGAPAMMMKPAVCGNGTVEPPEQCEAANLNNATCTSLMMGVGVLSCNKMTCMYDTSMCGAAHGGMGGSGNEGMGGTGH